MVHIGKDEAAQRRFLEDYERRNEEGGWARLTATWGQGDPGTFAYHASVVRRALGIPPAQKGRPIKPASQRHDCEVAVSFRKSELREIRHAAAASGAGGLSPFIRQAALEAARRGGYAR